MGFADSRKHVGVYFAQVARTERITPHMVRVTFAGEDLRRLPARGFDQWVRLFLPRPGAETDFTAVPQAFNVGGYVKYLTARSGTRPPFRNYTVRAHRPHAGEVDVDFVAHGDAGIAGPWAQTARPGENVAMIDQGCGFEPIDDAPQVLLAGDESALPAIAGILRDLPRDRTGQALLEVPGPDDQQELDAPEGVVVRWLPRSAPHDRPGALLLEAVRATPVPDPAAVQAYLAGEQQFVAEARRHLVAAGVPKPRIAFTGYWRVGRAG